MKELEKEDFDPFRCSSFDTKLQSTKRRLKGDSENMDFEMSYARVNDKDYRDSDDDEDEDPKTHLVIIVMSSMMIPRMVQPPRPASPSEGTNIEAMMQNFLQETGCTSGGASRARIVPSVREPSLGSNSMRISQRGDIPSTLDKDIGKLVWMRTLLVESLRFDKDLKKQQAMMMQLGAQRFGGAPVSAADPEEDLVEDTEEDLKGSDDYVPLGYLHEPVDPEDFDP
ncbi:hypothetical protein FNV43_RR19056 [Rhamnella rubrinervis]|uniref:Uncharacterized protein n=1 Tax=Rhamnella rubrinervis TaxID=2594499 RepID=A0A8K0GY65_9ROSA|nr:hypothetical protein FNV43_RR19056 [Rhamnella rubrinervis]